MIESDHIGCKGIEAESTGEESPLQAFGAADLEVVTQAVEIAEDVTANFFKLSTSKWRHVRYDVRTLVDLRDDEIVGDAFAQINRYSRCPQDGPRRDRYYDYFKICLQDHNILAALERDPQLGLLPLSVYVITHELVHVVRFCTFAQSFVATAEEREAEERLVHRLTLQALKPLRLRGLDYVRRSYERLGKLEEFRDRGKG